MRIAGRRPVMTPKITAGTLLIQVKNEIEARLSILLSTPTNASGIVQNMIMMAIKAYVA